MNMNGAPGGMPQMPEPSADKGEVRFGPENTPRRRYIFPDGRVAMLSDEEAAEEKNAYYAEVPKGDGADRLHNKKSDLSIRTTPPNL